MESNIIVPEQTNRLLIKFTFCVSFTRELYKLFLKSSLFVVYLQSRSRLYLTNFFFISVRRNNGSAPSHWRAGAGGIARKGLQSLEALKLVEKDPNGGRRLSSQGRRDLDRIAAQIVAVKKE